jgi:hypothetical protein
MLDVMDQSADPFRRNETKQNNLTAGQHSKKATFIRRSTENVGRFSVNDLLEP